MLRDVASGPTTPHAGETGEFDGFGPTTALAVDTTVGSAG
jgi:hypothetical protein